MWILSKRLAKGFKLMVHVEVNDAEPVGGIETKHTLEALNKVECTP